jgi:hypothetical protein
MIANLTVCSISDDDIDSKPPIKKAAISKAKPKVETKMDLDDSDDDCEPCD